MAIERWIPRRTEMAPWRTFEEMDRFMDEMFRNWMTPLWRTGDMGWALSIEILDKKDSILVRAEVPGMRKEDIDVSVIGNALTVSGERKQELKRKKRTTTGGKWHTGSFLAP